MYSGPWPCKELNVSRHILYLIPLATSEVTSVILSYLPILHNTLILNHLQLMYTRYLGKPINMAVDHSMYKFFCTLVIKILSHFRDVM